MSERVEAVRRVVEAINRSDIDAAVESLSQDFEIDFSNSLSPMAGIYRGRDGAREFLTSFHEPWAALEFDTDETIELEDGRVLMASEVRTRGHGSGIEVSAKGATIWAFRDSEVAAVKLYQSKAEALDAAGLSA
jgi:ketosteroid isomerase-like protein